MCKCTGKLSFTLQWYVMKQCVWQKAFCLAQCITIVFSSNISRRLSNFCCCKWYPRIHLLLLNQNERVTKTVARTFCPDFNHHIDFPCPLMVTSDPRVIPGSQQRSHESTSLAEMLESAEATFEIWHQSPTGLYKGETHFKTFLLIGNHLFYIQMKRYALI